MEKATSKETEESKKPRRRETSARGDDKESEKDPAPVAEGKQRRKREDDSNKKTEDSGGWMGSSNFEKRNVVAVEEVENDITEDANVNTANKDKHFQEDKSAGDILEIPDLEEDGMDGDHRVAHAPRYILRKIPTLAELEADVKSSVPKEENGLDLSILLGVLVPKNQLVETDTTWTFESLLTEVTDELAGTEKLVVNTILKEPKEVKQPAAAANTSKSKSSSRDPSRRDK